MVPHDSPGSRAEALRRRGIRIPTKVLVQTRATLSKHVKTIARKADEHEHFINKVTYSLGVLCFGTFCFILGRRPYDIPRLYAAFFLIAAPLRWAYYKSKKWHYFLLDFCYYANAILLAYLVWFPTNAKLFLLCFAFSEGPLAWALVVWRCSLVFSSVDKIVSVLIHLLPGTVLYIIRWWDPVTFPTHTEDDTGPFPPWPQVPGNRFLALWMLGFPLLVYCIWQMLYYLIVEVLRRQRLVRDPEVLTSFRELSRQHAKSNSTLWKLSGMFGDAQRLHMFLAFQATFTVATVALTLPMFRSYRLHTAFQLFKALASVWNGGNFFFDVMPRQVQAKAAKRGVKVAPVSSSEEKGTSPDKGIPAESPRGRKALESPKEGPKVVHEGTLDTPQAVPHSDSRTPAPVLQESDEDDDVWEEVWEEIGEE